LRIFKNKLFNKWALKQKIEDHTILKMVGEIMQDLYEANLGGMLYKKRIPVSGRGKRGGTRAIVAFKLHKIAVFIYGFSKNQQHNITNTEMIALKKLTSLYVSYSDNELNHLVNNGHFTEIKPCANLYLQ